MRIRHPPVRPVLTSSEEDKSENENVDEKKKMLIPKEMNGITNRRGDKHKLTLWK